MMGECMDMMMMMEGVKDGWMNELMLGWMDDGWMMGG